MITITITPAETKKIIDTYNRLEASQKDSAANQNRRTNNLKDNIKKYIEYLLKKDKGSTQRNLKNHTRTIDIDYDNFFAFCEAVFATKENIDISKISPEAIKQYLPNPLSKKRTTITILYNDTKSQVKDKQPQDRYNDSNDSKDKGKILKTTQVNDKNILSPPQQDKNLVIDEYQLYMTDNKLKLLQKQQDEQYIRLKMTSPIVVQHNKSLTHHPQQEIKLTKEHNRAPQNKNTLNNLDSNKPEKKPINITTAKTITQSSLPEKKK